MATKLLPLNQLTLSPYTLTDEKAAADLPQVSQDGDARRILTFDGLFPADDGTGRTVEYKRPALTREWQRVTMADGRHVEIRLASCGLPHCFCAGEFRFVQ